MGACLAGQEFRGTEVREELQEPEVKVQQADRQADQAQDSAITRAWIVAPIARHHPIPPQGKTGLDSSKGGNTRKM